MTRYLSQWIEQGGVCGTLGTYQEKVSKTQGPKTSSWQWTEICIHCLTSPSQVEQHIITMGDGVREQSPLRAAVLGYSNWLHCFQAPGQCFDKVLPWSACTNLVWATCFIPIVNVLETEHSEDYVMRNWIICLPCFYNSQIPESSRKVKEI